MTQMKPSWRRPLVYTGKVCDGSCDRCGASGKVGIVYAGDEPSDLIFLCRNCGREMGVS